MKTGGRLTASHEKPGVFGPGCSRARCSSSEPTRPTRRSKAATAKHSVTRRTRAVLVAAAGFTGAGWRTDSRSVVAGAFIMNGLVGVRERWWRARQRYVKSVS